MTRPTGQESQDATACRAMRALGWVTRAPVNPLAPTQPDALYLALSKKPSDRLDHGALTKPIVKGPR